MRRAALMLACLLVISAGTTFAHPGGLDKYGGHVDSSTGIWHYHGGGSASSTPLSYGASPAAAAPEPVTTVGDLISQLNAAWSSGDLSHALTLCDQIKTALAVEISESAAASALAAADEAAEATSPIAVHVGSGIVATITFPVSTAYITSDSIPSGNTYGAIKINIPDAMNLDNRLFKLGQSVFSATFSSSDPKVVTVSDKGSLGVKAPGEVRISVAIGEASVEIPIRVVQLPLKAYSSKSAIATSLGFPDATAARSGNELWYWAKYPDMCIELSSYLATIHSSWNGQFEKVWLK